MCKKEKKGFEAKIGFGNSDPKVVKFKIEDDSDFTPGEDFKLNFDGPLKNKDQDLIEGKNEIRAPNPWPGVAPPPTFKQDSELEFWKEVACRFFDVLKVSNGPIINCFSPEEEKKITEEYKRWRRKNGESKD